MPNDNKNLILYGVAAIGGVLLISVAMLGLIAWAHDGEVATTIVAQLIDVIRWATFTLGALLGVTQGAAALVSMKQASASAQVQTAQAAASTPAPTTPTPQAEPQPAAPQASQAGL